MAEAKMLRFSLGDEMVWTCAGETQWIQWTKEVEHGAARKEKKRKTVETAVLMQ